MEDIMKIVKSHEESGLLIKWTSEAIKNEAKEQESGFIPMLFRTLAVSILGNALSERGVITTGEGVITAVKIFNASTSFNYFWSTKTIFKMNLSLMVFIQEIIYLKYRMGHI